MARGAGIAVAGFDEVRMDLNIDGRRALVLGASRGLGAAIAKSLLKEGVIVFGAARDLKAIGTWRDGLEEGSAARLHPLQLDLAEPDGVKQAATAALASGPIDILINNTGGPPPSTASGATAGLWTQHFQQMAVSIFELTQLILPSMLTAGWGRILTIASSGVEQPIPNLALSNAIRSSIVGWSKTLSAEVAARGVTVNVLVPGRIHTDRVDALDKAAAVKQGKPVGEIAAASAATIPTGRYGTPDEFADVATFLVSDRASYVTGSLIRVDGGLIRSI
jgi:3-oxoacyl-[acyl-carrier protein] reductase